MPERRRKVEGGEEPSSEDDDDEEEEDSRASMWRGGKRVGLARQAIRQGADMVTVTGHFALLQTGGQLHCGSHCGTVRGRRAGADCGEDTHPTAAQTFTWHR